jgi:hypothetical protein
MHEAIVCSGWITAAAVAVPAAPVDTVRGHIHRSRVLTVVAFVSAAIELYSNVHVDGVAPRTAVFLLITPS